MPRIVPSELKKQDKFPSKDFLALSLIIFQTKVFEIYHFKIYDVNVRFIFTNIRQVFCCDGPSLNLSRFFS